MLADFRSGANTTFFPDAFATWLKQSLTLQMGFHLPKILNFYLIRGTDAVILILVVKNEKNEENKKFHFVVCRNEKQNPALTKIYTTNVLIQLQAPKYKPLPLIRSQNFYCFKNAKYKPHPKKQRNVLKYM